MITNMVTATSDELAARCFVGDLNIAVEFAHFLLGMGWRAQISFDVDTDAHPRIKEEAECADALIRAYELYVAGVAPRKGPASA